MVAARVLTCRALVAAHLGAGTLAAELAADAIRSATELGLPIWAAEAELGAAAEVLYLAGDPVAGAERAASAADRFRGLHARTYMLAAEASHALLLAVAGRDAEAREIVNRSRPDRDGSEFERGTWLPTVALLDARAGRNDGLAEARTEASRHPDLPARLDELEAALRRRDGDAEGADDLLRQALRSWRTAGSVVMQGHVSRALADPAWPGRWLERVWLIEPPVDAHQVATPGS